MNHEVPFDSVESAHKFVDLLTQVVLETRHDIEADIQREANSNLPRRLEALQLTVYKMQTLEPQRSPKTGSSALLVKGVEGGA